MYGGIVVVESVDCYFYFGVVIEDEKLCFGLVGYGY